tara:strand:- start:198 stop:1064 length:867 start_codon:yes stop_codon:yes gene_type:complete
MIEPELFNCNEQTASSNHYQKKNALKNPNEISQKALIEFNNLKNEIEKRGIKITSLKGSKECPDHIFPNWFITFEDKTMQIFSMMAPNRRLEKKPEMVEHLKKSYQLTSDMSHLEEKDIFLESTSSMVFDRANKCVYAGLSPRTNEIQLQKWCLENKYELVMFETESHTGLSIYHTDVLMYVGTEIIGICFDVIKPQFREIVREKVERFHEVLELSRDQILNFCGNAIEAKNKNNELFLIISTKAYKSLTESQIKKLLIHFKEIIHSDISTIEKYGGGSARCMLTELF